MERFIAFIKKYYLNIWIRNVFILSIIIFFNLLSKSVETLENRDNPVEINVPNIVFSVFMNTILASILYFLNFYFLKYMKMNEIQI
jgi:hypothetical protein